MKNIGLAILAMSAIFAGHAVEADDEVDKDAFKTVNQKAFKPGEKLIYRLTYGVFDAGEATLSVEETSKMVRGRKLWKVKGIGKTISAFEWFTR